VGTFDPLIIGAVGTKLAWICAGLLAIGLALHAILGVTQHRSEIARQTTSLSAAALATSVLARLGFSAVELSGDLHGAADLLPVVWTVQRNAVIMTLIGAGALALGALLSSRLVVAMGVVAAAGAFGMTGHAQGVAVPSVAGLIVALHVLLAGFWATAPLVLWPRKGLTDDELAARHKRFGAIALTAVPALFVAGGALALWFGGGMNGLIGSAYGLAISAKLLLATAALCVGAWNRLSLVRLMTTDPVKAKHHLRRAMILDSVLILGAAFAVALATTVAAPHG
jgi:putative copper export protein